MLCNNIKISTFCWNYSTKVCVLITVDSIQSWLLCKICGNLHFSLPKNADIMQHTTWSSYVVSLRSSRIYPLFAALCSLHPWTGFWLTSNEIIFYFRIESFIPKTFRSDLSWMEILPFFVQVSGGTRKSIAGITSIRYIVVGKSWLCIHGTVHFAM